MSTHGDRIRAHVEIDADTSAVTASWRRCLTIYRLDPERAEPPRPDPGALLEARARAPVLRRVAEPCLDQLFALLADTDCAVFLSDKKGLALDIRTTRKCDPWGRPPADWPGTSYAEASLGTNSLGTCLTEQRSVIIRGEEHFLACLSNRVGMGAPLFGPDGVLVGSLNLNQNCQSHDARFDTFLSTSLANFARRIETEMFAHAHPETRLVLASPKGRNPDALLAIDLDDRVVGATRGARRLLALRDEIIACAPNVDEVYDTAGRREGDDLAEVERRAIVRALARCGGNLSAAARAVGISRSTLYRKLRSYEETQRLGTSKQDSSEFKPHPST